MAESLLATATRPRTTTRFNRSRSVLPLGAVHCQAQPFQWIVTHWQRSLGFDHAVQNSIDAVSDRDFAAEYFILRYDDRQSISSKLSEQIVLYTSAEFGFFELTDAYSTGSSLMPQKKNPDVFELARGKAGTMIGMLTGFCLYSKDCLPPMIKIYRKTKRLSFRRRIHCLRYCLYSQARCGRSLSTLNECSPPLTRP